MVNMQAVFDAATARGIYLTHYSTGDLKAVTLEINERYAIFIDFFAFNSLREIKSVAAHEIGHVATGTTHKVDSPFDLIARHEWRANRWAYENFLPVEELQAAFAAGCCEAWELAEWFDLPEKTIKNALRFYTEARGIDFNNL